MIKITKNLIALPANYIPQKLYRQKDTVYKKLHRHYYFGRKNPRRILKVILKAAIKYVLIILLVNITLFIICRILLGYNKIPTRQLLKNTAASEKSITYSKNFLENTFRLYKNSKKFFANLKVDDAILLVHDLPSAAKHFSSYLSDFLYHFNYEIKKVLLFFWQHRASWQDLYCFLKSHLTLIKRIFDGFLAMLFGFLARRLAALFIIPLLGISTISFMGFNLGELSVGAVSLIISQIGIFVVKSIGSLACKLAHTEQIEQFGYTVFPYLERPIQLTYESVGCINSKGLNLDSFIFATLFIAT